MHLALFFCVVFLHIEIYPLLSVLLVYFQPRWLLPLLANIFLLQRIPPSIRFDYNVSNLCEVPRCRTPECRTFSVLVYKPLPVTLTTGPFGSYPITKNPYLILAVLIMQFNRGAFALLHLLCIRLEVLAAALTYESVIFIVLRYPRTSVIGNLSAFLLSTYLGSADSGRSDPDTAFASMQSRHARQTTLSSLVGLL